MNFITSLLNKAIPKNIAGALGLIQSIFVVGREVLMVATRICAVLIPGDKDDKIVAKIKDIFDKAEAIFEKAKKFLLSAE